MDASVLPFWLCNGALFLAYVGYPVMAALIVGLKGGWKREVRVPDCPLPSVSFVIPAFDEAGVIGEKIRNTLSQDYPPELLQVIVVTDGSTDGTPEAAASFREVTHLHAPERRGKAHAMDRGAAASPASDVLVFSDANTLLRPSSIRRLVAPFSDPTVGAVCGEKRVLEDGADDLSGERVYWGYESLVKRLDASLYTVVGAVGELMAVRSGLWRPIPEDTVLDDLHVSLGVCLDGSRIDYAPEALATEAPSRSLSEEWERKVRISAGSCQALGRFASLLNPFRYGVLSIQFFFRKVMRWVFCPPALILALPAALFAYRTVSDPGWLLLSGLLAWSLFSLMALGGWLLRRRSPGRLPILHLPFYFFFMHAAALWGIVRYIRGGQSVNWRKAERR